MGGHNQVEPISGQELSRWRSLPADAFVSAAVVHQLVDELMFMRRVSGRPKLPTDAAALRRSVETLAVENETLRRLLVNAASAANDLGQVGV